MHYYYGHVYKERLLDGVFIGS